MSPTWGQVSCSWRELVLLCGLVTTVALDRWAKAMVRPWVLWLHGLVRPSPDQSPAPKQREGLVWCPGASLHPHSHEGYPIT